MSKMVEFQEQVSFISTSPSFSAEKLGEVAARVISELAVEEKQEEEDEQRRRLRRGDRDEASVENAENRGESSGEQLRRGYESQEESEGDDESSGEFEFRFVCRDPDASPMSADELFSNGRIRPLFPVFNQDIYLADPEPGLRPDSGAVRLPLRNLFDREADRPAYEPAQELEEISAGSYCVWTPRSVPASPDRYKKNRSTGSSKRWKFRDLIHRSGSDGKETLLFLSQAATEKRTEKLTGRSRNSAEGAVGSTVSAHENHYLRNRVKREGDRRRTFLPYKQDIVGFFANVNGLSRNLRPL